MRRTLVYLGVESAIEAVENATGKLMWQYGIKQYNYKEGTKEDIIERIKRSPYGGGVCVDGNNVTYVEIPSECDMF